MKKESIDIIVPVYNEQECLDEVMNRLLGLRKKMDFLEIKYIFVNDGSKDDTSKIINTYAAKHKYIKLIEFSRNFGHQMAVTAGLDYSDAEFVAIIDADLQDPPELLGRMFKLLKKGYDVVYGQREQRKGETIFKKVTARWFYRIMNRICHVEIPLDTGDFRIMRKKVVLSLKSIREKHRFIRGLVPWVGFKSAPFLYTREERFAGETKYPFRKMLRFALDAIFSFTVVPLKIATYLGLFIVGIGLLGGLVVLYLKIFTNFNAPGITALILTVLILGGIQIVMLGVMGEYVGRIFEEAKDRPLYIISNTKNIVQRKIG